MSVPAALRFTYGDYLLLDDDRRYEVVDGELLMTPAPTPHHQQVALTLARRFADFVESRRLGTILIAPCDVVLSEINVFQPDILLISVERRALIEEKKIAGAPDLVVEVLSPSTEQRDRIAKAKQYARFGVREMWLVDPAAKTIEVLVQTAEGFRREGLYGAGQTVRSAILVGLEFPLDSVF